jgi:hypothetical protein
LNRGGVKIKHIKFIGFYGNRGLLVFLLIFFFIPGIVYWIVKRREFSFDILSLGELAPEVEKLKRLQKRGYIDEEQFERIRDDLLSLAEKANNVAYKRKPNVNLIKKYEMAIERIRYWEKMSENEDMIGKNAKKKMLKDLSKI